MSYSTVKSKNDINISKIGSNVDKVLAKNLNKLLPNKHHVTGFVGTSGSGKTNAMINLLIAKKKNGVRNSYKKLYDKIIIVSPTLASLKQNIFENLPEEQKFEILNEDTIDSISDLIQEHDDLNKLVIFDDVGSQLKNHERELGLLIQKYRNDRARY